MGTIPKRVLYAAAYNIFYGLASFLGKAPDMFNFNGTLLYPRHIPSALHRNIDNMSWSANVDRIVRHFENLSDKHAALIDLEKTNFHFAVRNMGPELSQSDEQMLRCILKTISLQPDQVSMLRLASQLPRAHKWWIEQFLTHEPRFYDEDIELTLSRSPSRTRRRELCSYWYKLKDKLFDWSWKWAEKHGRSPSTVITDTVGSPFETAFDSQR